MTELAARMNASNYLLDTFVAQGFSMLTECRARPIGPDFPHYSSWLSQFTLTSTLAAAVRPEARVVAYAILRRAIGAVDDFDEACAVLKAFVSGEREIRTYFRSLRRFEGAIAQLYQAQDIGRNVADVKLFEKNDGSAYQRLNMLYNEGRHYKVSELPPGHVQVVAMENAGLRTPTAALTFDELRELLHDLCTLAGHIAACRAPTPEPA